MIKATVVIFVLFLNGQSGFAKFQFDPPHTCQGALEMVLKSPNVATAKIMECNDPNQSEAGPQEESNLRVAIAPLTNG